MKRILIDLKITLLMITKRLSDFSLKIIAQYLMHCMLPHSHYFISNDPSNTNWYYSTLQKLFLSISVYHSFHKTPQWTYLSLKLYVSLKHDWLYWWSYWQNAWMIEETRCCCHYSIAKVVNCFIFAG